MWSRVLDLLLGRGQWATVPLVVEDGRWLMERIRDSIYSGLRPGRWEIVDTCIETEDAEDEIREMYAEIQYTRSVWNAGIGLRLVASGAFWVLTPGASLRVNPIEAVVEKVAPKWCKRFADPGCMQTLFWLDPSGYRSWRYGWRVAMTEELSSLRRNVTPLPLVVRDASHAVDEGVEPFFERYRTVADVEAFLNADVPRVPLGSSGDAGVHIAHALVAAKLVGRQDIDQLAKVYAESYRNESHSTGKIGFITMFENWHRQCYEPLLRWIGQP